MKDKQYNSWDDMLRSEGILCRGYGVIPKYAMLDRDLTLQAKAIYAYFCSLSGKGTTSFPGKETIKSILGLGEESYYTHRRLLEDQGYITITQTHGKGGSFQSNVYTIVENPKKFFDAEPISDYQTRIFSRICIKGIKSAGYGIIPYSVMSDPRLNIKEKGVYAYFASYTGSGDTAFPSVDKITSDLQVSLKSYRSYLKKLKETGYIITQQRNINGTFSVNDYYLCSFDESDENFLNGIIPWSKKPSTVKSMVASSNPSTEEPWSKKPSAVDRGTINNIPLTNNNLTKNISSNQSAQTYENTVPQQMDRCEAIGYVRELLAYEDIPLCYPDADMPLIDNLISIMAEPFWSRRSDYRVGKSSVSSEELRKAFSDLTMDHLIYVIECVKLSKTHILNVRSYYMTALYNAPNTMDAYYERKKHFMENGNSVTNEAYTPETDYSSMENTRKLYERMAAMSDSTE